MFLKKIEQVFEDIDLGEEESYTQETNEFTASALDVEEQPETDLLFSLEYGLGNASETTPTIIVPADTIQINGNGTQRVVFTGFYDATLFDFDQDDIVPISNGTTLTDLTDAESCINSGVIGSTVKDEQIQDLQNPIIIRFPLLFDLFSTTSNLDGTTLRVSLYNPVCVFYEENTETWSPKGCQTFFSRSKQSVECRCNHLTSFAVIMSVDSDIQDPVLDILSYIGVSLSLLGIILTILTYLVFRFIFTLRSLRSNKTKVFFLHFLTSLSGMYICFIIISSKTPNTQDNCTTAGIFMQYFAISVFSWMLFQIIDMYLKFVKVWNTQKITILEGCLFGWGLPALIVIITISVHFGVLNSNYKTSDDDERMYPMYRETAICWMTSHGFTYAFLVPMAIFITAIVVLYIIIVCYLIYKRSCGRAAKMRASKNNLAQKHLFNALAIGLLCGPAWVVGFFMNLDKSTEGVTSHVLAYIFVILNAFQGLWIFIVHVALQKPVQVLWMKVLCPLRMKKSTS